MVINNSNKKLYGTHSHFKVSTTSTKTTDTTTYITTATTDIMGNTNINTISGKHSRRPSLTRKRSSQRLIKKIGIDLDTTLSHKDDYSYHSTDSDSLEFTVTHNSSGNKNGAVDVNLESLSTSNHHDDSENSNEISLPNLTSLKIYNGDQDKRTVHVANPQNTFDVIEVPFVKAYLDPSLPEDYLKDDILNIIQTLRIPKWYRRGYLESPLNRFKLILNKISGAMTNAIFKIQYQGLPSLLLRIYGRNNDSIIDRDSELQILARLSIQNIGPSLYGCFENGRFEQFLENATTLTKDDIRDWKISQRIARRMKELHTGIPLLKSEFENGPESWRKIEKWLGIIEEHPNWIDDKKRIQDIFNCEDWFSLKKNVCKYKDWLFKNSPKNSLVFCHNDTQYGNLLFNSPLIDLDSLSNPDLSIYIDNDTQSWTPSDLSPVSTDSLFPSTSNVSLDTIINPPKQDQIQDKKLVVIDFEYSGPNPASYDLANHFSEWMHDYSCSKPWSCNSSLFPTKEQLLNFLYSYVSHLKSSSNVNKRKATKELDDEVRFFYNDVIKWRATVQLFWSIWSIIQSGELQKDEESLKNQFEGINGEKYVITVDPIGKNDNNDNSDEFETISDEKCEQEVLEEDNETEGVNIDTFDYLKYCGDKISVFWGDLIGLGIISLDDIIDVNRIQRLDTEMI